MPSSTPRARPNRGSQLLAQWFAQTNTPKTRLAADIGVTEATVYSYIAGRHVPTIHAGVKLEALTGVPVASWATPPDETAVASAARFCAVLKAQV